MPTVSVNQIAAGGFGRAAAEYERARPGYPDAAVDAIALACGIGPGTRVLDLACGTGKFTRPLLALGAAVTGADPVDAMLRQLRAQLPQVPVARSAAEALPFAAGCFDAVCVAQGFHWFDGDAALAQIARVLRPGGALALLWNVRDTSVAWVAALNQIFARYEGDVATLRFWRGAWKPAFERTALFTPFTSSEFPYEQVLTRAGVIERIRSVSFIATLPDAERARVVRDVEAILDADPLTRGSDRIVLPYRTELYVCERI